MWHVYMSFLAFNSVPCTGVNHINRSVNQSIHIVLYVASESEALIGVNRFKVTIGKFSTTASAKEVAANKCDTDEKLEINTPPKRKC